MGNATIFAGSKIKALKSILNLNGGADVISSTTDPTAVAVSAEPGSLLLNTSSGKLYRKNDSGSSTNWSEVGSGGAGINYVSNPNAASSTAGWSTYADAAGAQPVDGAGGSPNVTWTRSTVSPLRGAAEFLFTKDAANRQGQGVATDFTIDLADQATVLQVSFDYDVTSGTYADGDLTIYLVADPAGTPVVIQPAGFRIMSGTVGTKLRAKATFQTQATGTSYRLVFHVASTSALAYTVAIDNVVVGPQMTNIGPSVTDWVDYVPTISNFGTTSLVFFRSRRVGDSLEVQGLFRMGTGAAAPGSVTLGYAGRNGGVQIDSTKLTATAVVGWGSVPTASTTYFGFAPIYDTVTDIIRFGVQSSTTHLVQPVNPSTLPANSFIQFFARVPIVGWSSNTVMSNDTDTRVVAASAFRSTTQVVTNATDIVVGFNSINFDTHGAFDITTNFRYVAPVPGYYDVKAQVVFAANATNIRSAGIRKNGVLIQRNRDNAPIAGNPTYVSVETNVFLNAGDYVDMIAFQNSGGNLNVGGDYDTFMSINRLSGPAQVAASETVAARYINNAGTTIASGGTGTVIPFATRDFDTHSFVNGSTGVATIPVSGKYRLTCSAYFAGASFTAVTKTILARVNGAGRAFIALYAGAAVTGNLGLNGSAAVQLNAGDTVDFQVATNETGTRNLDTLSGATSMSIVRVGN